MNYLPGSMYVVAFFLLTVLSFSNAESELHEIDTRIINGYDVKPGEIPYQVSLQEYPSAHFCSGVILTRLYVITTANCVEKKQPWQIVVSSGSIYFRVAPYKSLVRRIIIHEEYNAADSWNNNIALLEVIKPLNWNKEINFVQFPPVTQVLRVNDLVKVSGWGSTIIGGIESERLKQVDLVIADQKYCKYMYSSRNYTVHDTQICAYDPYVNKGSCYGDSGGPLTINGKIIGLVSWGMSCARTDYPTVYTRLESYLSWIIFQLLQN